MITMPSDKKRNRINDDPNITQTTKHPLLPHPIQHIISAYKLAIK